MDLGIRGRSALVCGASKGGPFVPAQALVREGARRFVWVVDGDVARRREVQAEPVTPQWIRVRAGVAAQDAVVVEGVAGLTDGVRVAVAR
jgi:NAD(P)-dependent dehydrogenase (short-subunit alcohol dehydrogenase family)